MSPVKSGETTPPRFPAAFCIPDHFPAAAGPARPVGRAHTLELNRPMARQAAISRTMATDGSRTMAAGSTNVQSNNPLTTNPLRTRVAVAPRAIKRSEAQPETRAESALAQKGRAPNSAKARMLKCRSMTR